MKRFGAVLMLVWVCSAGHATAEQTARGTVYVDANGNRLLDAGERPLAGVRVSNGREIVATDEAGQYAIPVEDDTIVFVLKPRGFRTALNKHMLPQFYYIHKPKGSPPNLRYAGVPPTGPLPERIDFPLYRQSEPEAFKAILFGDTQPRDVREVNFIARETIPELIGTDAAFGVTLGDVVFDDLAVFEPLNAAVALIGIPWYNVLGNHDLNFDLEEDRYSDETFERLYGPPYYAFDYGPVHFIVLDDVDWHRRDDGSLGYVGGLGESQLSFVENDLALIPEQQLVVLMMHIPFTHSWRDIQRDRLFRMMEQRPFCLSISAHEHVQTHHFLTGKHGWRGAEPHHHIVNVTVCGSWFTGAPDETGIPHALMPDGAPNGYAVISFDGHTYRHTFKGARKPADYQMNIYLADEVSQGYADVPLQVNVFNGSARSVVEVRVGGSDWEPLSQVFGRDPEVARINREEANRDLPYRPLANAGTSRHLWGGTLAEGLPPGTHMVQVRTTDMFGQTYLGFRPVRVLPQP